MAENIDISFHFYSHRCSFSFSVCYLTEHKVNSFETKQSLQFYNKIFLITLYTHVGRVAETVGLIGELTGKNLLELFLFIKSIYLNLNHLYCMGPSGYTPFPSSLLPWIVFLTDHGVCCETLCTELKEVPLCVPHQNMHFFYTMTSTALSSPLGSLG